MAKTTAPPPRKFEIGLVCDAGTSQTGIHGLSDLFRYAGEFASKRQPASMQPIVRITYWRAHDERSEVRCVQDSAPGEPLLLPCS